MLDAEKTIIGRVRFLIKVYVNRYSNENKASKHYWWKFVVLRFCTIRRPQYPSTSKGSKLAGGPGSFALE